MNRLLINFDVFWDKFHFINKIPPKDKSMCEKLWNKIISIEKKEAAITDIKKGSFDVYLYLKSKLL